MPKNDSRRDAETQRKRAFQSSLLSHQTVIPFTVAQASDFLPLSASLPLFARFLLHGHGLPKHRQPHPELGPIPDGRLHRNRPPMEVDTPLHDDQAQA